jgi:ParB family protein of integrating conjugative element (PFGI_1 class)
MAATAIDHSSGATLIRIAVTEIDFFDGNPRLIDNPAYERIKSSIRDSGLQQPLIVTRAPDAKHYTLESGGNTRLRIIQELYEEAGDPRFATAECVVRPWVSYDHVMIAHLKENDLRGELTFIEKAVAIQTLLQRLRSSGDRNGAALSQRALVERLSRDGYTVAQSALTYMRYAVERLYPVMPSALRKGMGRPTVSRLCHLDQAAGRLWDAWEIDTASAYDDAFLTLCRRHDAAFEIAALRRDLEYEIAAGAEASLETVRLILDAMLDGEAPPLKPKPPIDVNVTDTATAADGDDSTLASAVPSRREPVPAAAEETSSDTPTLAPTGIDTAGAGLENLRTHACQLAQSLAVASGLGKLVQETPRQGIGYLISDFPDAGYLAQCKPAERAKVSFLWWHLLAPCELTVMPAEEVEAVLPTTSRLRSALTSDESTALLDGIWTVDPGQVAHRFWHKLEDGQWGQLLDLQEIYRTARSLFSPESPLWTLR